MQQCRALQMTRSAMRAQCDEGGQCDEGRSAMRGAVGACSCRSIAPTRDVTEPRRYANMQAPIMITKVVIRFFSNNGMLVPKPGK